MFKLITTTEYTRRQFGSSGRRVIFFFCGWMTKYWVYFPLFPIMVACGYRVYVYELNHEHIISSDNNAYVGQLVAVKNDVKQLLAKLPSTIQAFTFGNSLGSEPALYILKQLPQIRAAVLNTVRGDIAGFLWDLPYGKSFKERYLALGYTKDRLYRELKPVEPMHEIELIKERPVLVYYSLADTVITPKNTKVLIDAFQKSNVNYKVHVGKRLNHFGISTLNHAMFWRWHRFMMDAKK